MNVLLPRDVLLTLSDIAKHAHPNETVMILEGDFSSSEIKVTGVLFQPYDADEDSTFFSINIPTGVKTVGTFHSHPGPSNEPSDADLELFQEYGLVHFIAHEPYERNNFACFDKEGRKIPFRVI